ncbi:hypothetical protein BZL30_6331 [Mycobacterium kansasii]|uniref:Uncharacterized protein n=1 Tax=Mycobacterium kansasii TaxID=1768 RepID=A0A1V3WV06_MYCKA|nr:hypothetical protein BZL30_6331 [Mycobacterium kansasii]
MGVLDSKEDPALGGPMVPAPSRAILLAWRNWSALALTTEKSAPVRARSASPPAPSQIRVWDWLRICKNTSSH